MAIEASLATAVLIAAGLFLQSFRQTQSTDPGFRREGLLLAAYDLTGRDVDAAFSRSFAANLLERLRALPDVEAAAIASSVPLDIHGLPARGFSVEGRARTDGARDRTLSNVVTPGYFKAMGIPIVAGSDFADLRDTVMPRQAVVNQEFVRRYIENREPLGRQVTVSDQPYVIVGVVRDSLYESFSEAPTPIVYMSYRDRPSRAGEIHLRTRLGDESMLAPLVRRTVRDVDQALPVYNIRTMTQHVDMNLALRKIPARMFVVLGPLVLALAAIGIYAVVAYSVSQRTSEIGVRVALGATASRVVGQIVRESLRVISAGRGAGLGARRDGLHAPDPRRTRPSGLRRRSHTAAWAWRRLPHGSPHGAPARSIPPPRSGRNSRRGRRPASVRHEPGGEVAAANAAGARQYPRPRTEGDVGRARQRQPSVHRVFEQVLRIAGRRAMHRQHFVQAEDGRQRAQRPPLDVAQRLVREAHRRRHRLE